MLTAILAICIHATNGGVECDIRVMRHIQGVSQTVCEAETNNKGARVRKSILADPKEKDKVVEVKYRGKCYTNTFASQVIENIPAWMANMDASYVITDYTEY